MLEGELLGHLLGVRYLEQQLGQIGMAHWENLSQAVGWKVY